MQWTSRVVNSRRQFQSCPVPLAAADLRSSAQRPTHSAGDRPGICVATAPPKCSTCRRFERRRVICERREVHESGNMNQLKSRACMHAHRSEVGHKKAQPFIAIPWSFPRNRRRSGFVPHVVVGGRAVGVVIVGADVVRRHHEEGLVGRRRRRRPRRTVAPRVVRTLLL
eukprot:3025137-Pleurochrysis_carterae.AAC.1